MRIADWIGLDWLLVSVVAVSMAMAFWRGLVRAIFGLVGFVGGFQLAAWNYMRVGDWMVDSKLLAMPQAARILAFLVIVIAVAAAFELVGRGMQKSLRKIGLGIFDRLLGAAFGFARGCLIGIGVLIAGTTVAPQAEALTSSVLSPYLFAVAHDVSFLVPQYLQQAMMNGAFDFKENPPR
jgi:membrane protein required for colicin V production